MTRALDGRVATRVTTPSVPPTRRLLGPQNGRRRRSGKRKDASKGLVQADGRPTKWGRRCLGPPATADVGQRAEPDAQQCQRSRFRNILSRRGGLHTKQFDAHVVEGERLVVVAL